MDKHVIINVGRQFGSGGKSVATALGKILGIPVYDNELITKAAEQSGFSASLFEQNDEKKSLLRKVDGAQGLENTCAAIMKELGA